MSEGRRYATPPPVTTPPPPPRARSTAPGRPGASAFVVVAVLVGVVVLVLALLLAGGRPARSVAGLPDAGPVTGWGLPAVRLIHQLAAVTTIGELLLAGVLLPGRPRALSALATCAVRSAVWSAGLWSVASVLLWVLTASETTGVPLSSLTAADLARHAAAAQGRAALLAGAISAALAYGCSRGRTSAGACQLLALAGAALLPLTVTGHAASTADHELAVSSLVVHVLAAAAWAGGLLALLLLPRRPAELAPAVARYSVVALACFVLVALSGLVSAYQRIGLTLGAWTSGYGGLVLVKTTALVALGAIGWQHRRRLVPALAAGRPGAFLSFAGVELSVMAGAFGLAVALSRTPTPATSTTAAPVPMHGVGHETVPTTLEPVSLTALLFEWRLNAVVVAVLGLFAASYLVGVRRLRATATPWPPGRSAAFASAMALAVLALCSGVATYAAAVLSVQVAQFLLLLVVVPLLFILSAPQTLLQRVRASPGSSVAGVDPASARSGSQLLADPFVSMGLVAGLIFAVYRTGLLDRSSGSTELSLMVSITTLAVGVLLMWPAFGTGAQGRPRRRADRVAPLLAAAVSLLVLAAELRLSGQALAGGWFVSLGLSWADPAADQRLAAVFAAGCAVLLLGLAVAAWRTAATARHLVGAQPPSRARPAEDSSARH